MAWRFFSGSTSPASAARNRSSACSTAKTPAASDSKTANECRLALAHQSCIDIQPPDPLRTQRPQAQRESDRRIHTARDEEEHIPAARHAPDLFLDPFGLIARVPVLFAARDVEQKIGQKLPSALGMHDFRVELHTVKPAFTVSDGGHRAGLGLPVQFEACRHRGHRVAMAHPDLLPTRDAPEQRRIAHSFEPGQAVFAVVARPYFPAQMERQQLLPVADPQHRRAEREDLRVNLRTALFIDARRTPGYDDRPHTAQGGGGRVARPDLGIHAEFADLSRDQVAILAAGVEHDNLGRRPGFRCQSRLDLLSN